MKHSLKIPEEGQVLEVESLFEANKEKLIEYSELLYWWNGKINLVSRGVSRETIIEHIKHSLLITLFSGFKEANEVIDTGTGGGLPGIPLAICYPDKNFILNDIVLKKTFAIKDMASKLRMNNVDVFGGNIADFELSEKQIVVTKHAFKIFELYNLIKAKQWKEIMFLKGYEEAQEEINYCEESLEMNVFKLDESGLGGFYSGKGVVSVKRGRHE